MVSALQKIVAKRLDDLGLGPIEAATKAGLERTYIRDIIQGKKHSVRSDKINALAGALHISTTELSNALLAKSPDAHIIPIMGYVGAGAEIMPEFEQVPEDGLDQVDIQLPLPDEMIAFEVRGDSMLPRFRDGDVIIVFREMRRPIDYYLGEEVALRTTDGKRYIKEIGKAGDGIVLLSSNARPIFDASIEWIGEIFSIMPRRQLSKFHSHRNRMAG